MKMKCLTIVTALLYVVLGLLYYLVKINHKGKSVEKIDDKFIILSMILAILSFCIGIKCVYEQN